MGSLAFGGCAAVFLLVTLSRATHSFLDAVVLVGVLIASWRFLGAAVVVDASGITYRAYHRTIRYPWQRIEAFGVGSSGVTLGLDGGREVWLMPTKPIALSRKRSLAEAERILGLIVSRHPDPSGFMVSGAEDK